MIDNFNTICIEGDVLSVHRPSFLVPCSKYYANVTDELYFLATDRTYSISDTLHNKFLQRYTIAYLVAIPIDYIQCELSELLDAYEEDVIGWNESAVEIKCPF